MPAALEVNWKAIETFMVGTGASFEETAQKFSNDEVEVTHWAIRKRAERENWPLPSKVLKKMAEMQVSKAVQNSDLTEKIADSWLQKGENHRSVAFQIAQKAMKEALSAPPEVKDWADVERIDKMARRASGLDSEDKAAVAVSLNLCMDRIGDSEDIQTIEVKGEVLPE